MDSLFEIMFQQLRMPPNNLNIIGVESPS